MAPIRVLFLLVAIAAATASAGKIPVGRHSHSLSLAATHDLQRQVSAQITALQGHRLNDSIVEKAIKKLEEFVRKIKETISQAEHELIDAAGAITDKILSKINDLIKKVTGVDLDLVAQWAKFEEKAGKCTATLKSSVTEILMQIRTDTMTCAAEQLDAIKDIGEQILDVANILEVVPARTFENIKACYPAAPTEAPTDAPTDAPTTDATTDAPTDATTDAPTAATTDAPTDAPTGKLRSWSGKWDTTVCIAKEVAEGFKDLEPVPAMVYKLVGDVRAVASEETQAVLEECSEKSVAGKGKEVQKLVAELAYCVIAPSEQ